jgi:DNA-binding transcriptional regulator/RsmH inhibitor MraZ
VEFLQKNLNPYNIEDRKLLRKLTDGNIIELDTNDRLLIPAEQKSYIKNAKDIVLTATGNFIEIWDYEKYARMNGEETDYANLVNNRLGVKTNNETI